jgi:hypothetical protein
MTETGSQNVIRIIQGAWRQFASLALVAIACTQLSGCGGSVSGAPSAPTSAGPLAITPATATLYSDLPTTFVITGGSGVYTVVSSDQAVVPVAGVLSGSAFTVAPNEVAADTTVTLTVRDNAGSLPATATLTVKPRTINNAVTITPSSSQAASCGTALCSGGDAQVSATLSQGGVPLTGRTVRFDVVSGDIGIITSAPGDTETTALTSTATTDSTGTARIRIRASATAASQTALLKITDVSSGFTQTTSVTIASSTSAALNAQPDTVRFTGPNTTTCANGLAANVIVFGGLPPYQLTQPAGFTINPTSISESGGSFTITTTGACSQTQVSGSTVTPIGSPIAIVDAAGNTKTVTVFNTPAPATPTGNTPFTVSPNNVTLDSCSVVANVALVGGSGTYLFAAPSTLTITISTNTASIQRNPGSTAATLTSPINISFSDGATAQTVAVSLTGQAAIDNCP